MLKLLARIGRALTLFRLAPAALMALTIPPPGAMAGDEPLLGKDASAGRCANTEVFSLALHGGTAHFPNTHASGVAFIERLLKEAGPALTSGSTSLDIVHGAIRAMEDSGIFNAGRGALANQAGVVEMDASIMDGRRMNAGAVASVKRVKNPISGARLVMERSPEVLRVGRDAEDYVGYRGGEIVDPGYFRLSGLTFNDIPLPKDILVTPPSQEIPPKLSAYSGIWGGVLNGAIPILVVVEDVTSNGARVVFGNGFAAGANIDTGAADRYQARFDLGALIFDVTNPAKAEMRARRTADGLSVVFNLANGSRMATTLRKFETIPNRYRHGTVGAVALDRCGNLAAGTSTGGFGSKKPGRVGDSPIIGAGTYANNRTAAISATGHGEYFMIHVIAHDISARMDYGRQSLKDAAYDAIHRKLTPAGGRGGVIAVDGDGTVAFAFNTPGMVRGLVTHDREPRVGVYKMRSR
jgi:isoaspartyl peptidase/L-asparaginase-like protein (Ntn-hydrolase superfamily)